MIDLHTHSKASNASIFNAGIIANEDGYFSLGIHPKDVLSILDWETFEQKLCNSNCLAIGECGLDKVIEAPLPSQTIIFKKQIALAEKYKKPLIIHVVRAHYELVSCLKNFALPVIIHGFNNSLRVLELYIKQGYYISLGAALLNNLSNAQKAIAQIPIGQLFLETDNSGLDINIIYEQASELLNLSVEELEQILKENFIRVFMV